MSRTATFQRDIQQQRSEPYDTDLERGLRMEALDGETRTSGSSLDGPILEATSEGSRRSSSREGYSEIDGPEKCGRELHD